MSFKNSKLHVQASFNKSGKYIKNKSNIVLNLISDKNVKKTTEKKNPANTAGIFQ